MNKLLRCLLATVLLCIGLGISPHNSDTIYAQGSITTVDEMPWGYQYVLSSGDIVEVGDSTTTDFKATIKTIRDDKWFSIGWAGGAFTPTLNDLTVSFPFNNQIDVSIYPVDPCDRLPDGGIEYDIGLSRKTNQSSLSLDIDWQGITWEKIYGLDVQYDEAKCEDQFGIEAAPYTITATSITGSDLVTYKTMPEYEVNSYLGTALQPHVSSETSFGINPNNGQEIIRKELSRTYLYIHRGHMTDALGQTAWVEDIHLDEGTKTLTFDLPSTWLKNADYPVHGVCGVDPAYAELMDNWDTEDLGTDATWSDYDVYTNHGSGGTNFNKGDLLEIIYSNENSGYGSDHGVRTDGSSVDRRINIHEAEQGGATHLRWFVHCHATTGLIETYRDDVSDSAHFYIVGVWENVTFTEDFDYGDCSGVITYTWVDFDTLNGSPAELNVDTVYQIVCGVNAEVDLQVGARTGGSSLTRYFDIHEAEGGGGSWIDYITKSDSSGDIECWKMINTSAALYHNMGHFDSGLDFVELWQELTNDGDGDWDEVDLTSYLDQDGRTVDVLCGHNETGSEQILGVRGGDSSASRYLTEHEAEDDGGATGEIAGFCMSVVSDSNGVVDLYSDTASEYFRLAGYFLPAGGACTPDIANTPASENLGTLDESSTYYAYGSAPSNPVVDGECTFTITNNSSCAVDLTVQGTNFTGGVGWTLTSGSPGENTVRITTYYSGQNPASGVVLTTSPQSFYSSLSASGTLKWDFKFETGTFTDGDGKSGTITIAATES